MIRLIAAIDRKRGIAKGGVQPWKIPEDEIYFKDKTHLFGGNVLMGSTTFEVIGHPLPNRRNFILTKDTNKIEGVEVVNNFAFFMESFPQDLWVIGGASVFEQTLEKADELYLTHIEADFGCDQVFPEFEQKFGVAEKSDLHEENGFIFRYIRYAPKHKSSADTKPEA